MARIGDSPEEQRILEMNEAQHREKVDREKRADQDKITRSFNQVMQERSAQSQAKQLVQKTVLKADPKKSEQKPGAQKQGLGLGSRGGAGELNKRAALAARALQTNLGKARGGMTSAAKDLESRRTDELSRGADEDRERIDRDLDGKDLDQVRQGEDQKALQRQEREGAIDPANAKIERDQERGRGGGSKDDREQKAEAVAAADGPKQAHQVKLPQEILEKIAKAVAIATAKDGRTEMQIPLKGTMLDGVTLKVSVKSGKVRCSFEGCDKQLRNLIESSKGDLMRQLGKHGLELEILRAKE